MRVTLSLLMVAVTIADSHAGGKSTSPDDAKTFPIAVWLQAPANAPKFKALGINLYVGLWKGPTEAQLADLKKHGMRVVCSQNETGLKFKDDPIIYAWMHGDEPDNAQSLGKGKGYGPPILPSKIKDDYDRIKKADPSRPVLLNLGQGVAWDDYIGRGVRRRHPEDYPEYVKGCDIASFDIYPAVHDHKDVAGKLWFVADGVSRLRKWTDDKKPVWNCIECTHIGNPKTKPTPAQVKAEVWMSLLRGSRGLIYFVHQFQPKFIEAALLVDEEMCAQVRTINRQLQELAPVLLSGEPVKDARVASAAPAVPVEAMVRRHDGKVYVFAVCMRGEGTKATFKISGLPAGATAHVLGEKRTLEIREGEFGDDFEAWGVRLYEIR